MNRAVELIFIHQDEETSFYSFKYTDDTTSEFDKFYEMFDTEEFEEEFNIITYWIEKIGKEGAIDRFFRPEKGNLMALPSPLEYSDIRLYVFKIEEGVVLLGNGGLKTTRTFNEDPILNAHAQNLYTVGNILMSEIKNNKITVYNNILYELHPIKFSAV